MTVVARGHDYAEAMARAYQAVDCIRFEGMHVRRDIGAKAAMKMRSGGIFSFCAP